MNTQVILALGAMLVAQTGIILTVLVLYINAKIDGKIDPLARQVDMLVQYMVSHEGKIAMLTERLDGSKR